MYLPLSYFTRAPAGHLQMQIVDLHSKYNEVQGKNSLFQIKLLRKRVHLFFLDSVCYISPEFENLN